MYLAQPNTGSKIDVATRVPVLDAPITVEGTEVDDDTTAPKDPTETKPVTRNLVDVVIEESSESTKDPVTHATIDPKTGINKGKIVDEETGEKLMLESETTGAIVDSDTSSIVDLVPGEEVIIDLTSGEALE